MSIHIIQGDCVAVMATLPECSLDAIVTDPPYEIGFMSKGWDKSGVAFDPATWREALRVLKPGGHMVAFGGTRKFHRLACAIEDAGFELRDTVLRVHEGGEVTVQTEDCPWLLAWVFGSGFPKSHDFAGKRSETTGARVIRDEFTGHPLASGWGTALKPAWEPIVLARKPLRGTVAANVLAHGTGALNIDGCRIETADSLNGGAYSDERKPSESDWVMHGGTIHNSTGSDFVQPTGRWPANLIHDGSEEVLQAFPQADSARANGNPNNPRRGANHTATSYGQGDDTPTHDYRDTGSAARFFYCAKAGSHDRHDGLAAPGPQFKRGSTLRDAENLGKARRGNHHPTVKPTDLMRYLCRLITPPGGTVLDPFCGSGSTLKAAELEGFSAIGIELDPAYVEIARRRIAADAPLFADVNVEMT